MSILTKGINTLTKFKRDEINEKTLKATYKAQKKYGFEMGTGEHATWNNEADAFKHAYMQWYMTWKYGKNFTKLVGDYHEWENPNDPDYECNMDKWNNAVGRDIAIEMDKKVTSGDMVYVEDYVRSDGTKVSGYYRSNPYC